MPEEGLTRVADRRGKLPKAEQAGLGRGDVDIAGPTRADDILQGRRRKGLYEKTIAGPTKARMRFGGIKIGRCRRAAGEDIKGVIEGMSFEDNNQSLRRRETPRRPKEGLISRVSARRSRSCRRARRRHTEVRSSYHFRVRTKFSNPMAAW
ncbi:hypothetical protein BY996DRAFT_6613636 [Phakopsora pachyrhizi]|nr:hypothetical protein BY996DRAFT_6613636 [Phakopsora pachyrhizi]